MSKSIERVREAARKAGLDIEIKRMGASTRTAEEAAEQCGCDVAQIVKSLTRRCSASITSGQRPERMTPFFAPNQGR